jgi:hypothetical protein
MGYEKAIWAIAHAYVGSSGRCCTTEFATWSEGSSPARRATPYPDPQPEGRCGVTIRDKLNAIRMRILLLGLVGLLLILLGAAVAASADSALLLAIAGSLVLFVAIFQLAVALRCPRCGAGLTRALEELAEDART